jgi:hypothetical protein
MYKNVLVYVWMSDFLTQDQGYDSYDKDPKHSRYGT